MNAPARRGERFTVRKQSSGYTYSTSYYVFDRQRGGRVTIGLRLSREQAAAEARSLNETIGWTA